MLSKLQEKVQCVREERKLNFRNEITEILVPPKLGGVPERENNCGNQVAENGRGKKMNCGNQVAENEGKKKLRPQHFYIIFTTNYRRLVIIGSNLNLTLRLCFCPKNNNQ